MSFFSGTYYNTTTGLITSAFDNLPFQPEPITNPADTFIDGSFYNPAEYYIDTNTGLPVLKTVQTIVQSTDTMVANGIEEVSFSNIATNSSVELDMPGTQSPITITVDDGILNLTYNEPGTYSIMFMNNYSLNTTFEVTAT